MGTNPSTPTAMNYRSRLASVRTDLARISQRIHDAAEKLHGVMPQPTAAAPSPAAPPPANVDLELDCVQVSLSAVENWASNALNALDRLEDSL